jgi:hypothetical protein
MTDRKLLLMTFLAISLGLTGCLSTSHTEDRDCLYPEIEYPVYKKRTITDLNGNIILLTLLGVNVRHGVGTPATAETNGMTTVSDVYVLWEMQYRTSRKFSVTFTANGSDSDYYIRTPHHELYPLTAVLQGPLFPEKFHPRAGHGGLFVFRFDGFDPGKTPVFNMVEGGRSGIRDAAYSARIKDPTRWNFLNCRAVRRTP